MDYRTTVLAIDSCADGKVCPALVRLDGDDGSELFSIVGKKITVPSHAAAMAGHIGPGEDALIIPAALIDLIRRTG